MKAETIFDNFFDTREITPTRLHNFADDAIRRLSADAVNNGWPALTAILQPAADALGQELGDVDATYNIRLGNTDTVDALLQRFAAYMKDNEPFIARAAGGKGSPAYLEFYPAGIIEYTRVNKTTAPTLLERVDRASASYSAALGTPLSTDLSSFKPLYERDRSAQQGSKGQVDENRSERTDARKALELALLRAVYQVGDQYPGNVAQCKSYFDFSRLYSAGRHRDAGANGGQPA